MALQHYIPAAFIGRFSSSERHARRRRRFVWVCDRRAIDRQIFPSSPEDLCRFDGLYDLPADEHDWLGPDIDRWGYEGRLSQVLDALHSHDDWFSARDWLTILVPFAAGLFSRAVTTNFVAGSSRIIAFQEMLAPMMVSEWTILHYPAGSLLTSDSGFAFRDNEMRPSLAIPVDPTTAISLTFSRKRRLATFRQGVWMTRLRHRTMTTANADSLRDQIAYWARDQVFGPSKELVSRVNRQRLEAQPRQYPPVIISEGTADLLPHVYDWFRAVSAINVPLPEADLAAKRIDLSALPTKWDLPVAFVFHGRERTRGGAFVKGNNLWMDMSLGIAIRNERWRRGDGNRGFYGVYPLEGLKALNDPIGLDWAADPDPRLPAGATMIRDSAMRDGFFDLSALSAPRRTSRRPRR